MPTAKIKTSIGLNVVEIIYFATPVKSLSLTQLAIHHKIRININNKNKSRLKI